MYARLATVGLFDTFSASHTVELGCLPLVVHIVSLYSFFGSESEFKTQMCVANYIFILCFCLSSWRYALVEFKKMSSVDMKNRQLIFCYLEGGSLTLIVNVEQSPHSTVAEVIGFVLGVIASVTIAIQYLPQLWVTWNLKVCFAGRMDKKARVHLP
jgi:hypothetical protein